MRCEQLLIYIFYSSRIFCINISICFYKFTFIKCTIHFNRYIFSFFSTLEAIVAIVSS